MDSHSVLKEQDPTDLTEFWKAVQSSWNTDDPDVSSKLHFFLTDCSVVEKSDTYLNKETSETGRAEGSWEGVKSSYLVKRDLRALSSPHTASPSVSLTQRSTAALARPNSFPTEWLSSSTQSSTSPCS